MSEEKAMAAEGSFDLIVTPSSGSIASNIEELRAWVKKAAEPYLGQLITDDQYKDAKKDLASLRKLKDALENERKRAKAIVMAPYTEFEKLYKEASIPLDEAIAGIDSQIKEIDASRKDARKKSVIAFILTEAKNMGGESLLMRAEREDVQSWLIDPKWLNVSVSDTAVQLAVRQRLLQMQQDLECIIKSAADGAPVAFDEYYRTGSLSSALEKKMAVDSVKAMFPMVRMPEMVSVIIPEEPEDPELLKEVYFPAVLAFPKYKQAMVKELLRGAGIRILREVPKKEDKKEDR